MHCQTLQYKRKKQRGLIFFKRWFKKRGDRRGKSERDAKLLKNLTPVLIHLLPDQRFGRGESARLSVDNKGMILFVFDKYSQVLCLY